MSKECLNQLCLVLVSFDLSSIMFAENMSVNISVFSVEGGDINSLYFQEFTFVNNLAIVGNISNTTFNFTTTNSTRGNSTQTQTTIILIITGTIQPQVSYIISIL